MAHTTKAGHCAEWAMVLVGCLVCGRAGAEELRFGLTTDGAICYTTPVGNVPTILQNIDGRLSFANDIKTGMRCLLRHAEKTPNGMVRVGGIIVRQDDGSEAQVTVFTVKSLSGKFVTGTIDDVALSTLAKMPCPIEGFHYGITDGGELVLFKPTATFVTVLQDLAAGCALNESLTVQHFMNGKFAMVSAEKLADGRIRLPVSLTRKPESSQATPAPPRAANETPLPPADAVIPGKGPGIWVTAIGRYGQAEGSAVDVYVLTEEEFVRYKKRPTQLRPRGKAPLMLGNLKPGRYHVALDQRLDEAFIRPKLFKRPSLSAVFGDSPVETDDPLADFADDMSAIRVLDMRVEPGSDGSDAMAYYQRKWYVADVREEQIAPVVCLLVKKGLSLEAMTREYPKTHSFHITASDGQMTSFFDGVGRLGAALTDRQRARTVWLLRHGGKVCLPGPQVPAVLSVGPGGRPRAQFALADAGPDGDTDLITLNEPVVRPQQPIALPAAAPLPAFRQRLSGTNEVRVVNPNDVAAHVGLRTGDKGIDLTVPPGKTASVVVGDGRYKAYFVYASQPNALYRGDDLTLKGHGAQITLVKVAGGNYAIRRVRQ